MINSQYRLKMQFAYRENNMNKPADHGVNKAVDSIQQRITDFAYGLDYQALPPEVINATKARIIDTLGALIGGFFGESCRIARNLAAQMPNPNGATVIGTRIKTAPDMAAFANAIAACHADITDSYHWPGSAHGHPSNLLTPVLAAAEHAQRSGREFITSVVIGYEIYLRFSDVFHNPGFDNGNFTCIGIAAAAGKLLGLSPAQLSHCISMAAVPNVMLKQAKTGMFYTARAGQAGRAGVFAALLARAGMEGPHLPFEGKAGWCDHVAGERFPLNTWGGNGTRFKILDTQIKNRPSVGNMIPSILAAEKLAPLRNFKEVRQVTVEVYEYAQMEYEGSGKHADSRLSAYYCIPYLVAAALMDGTVTLRSYNNAHLQNPELRALMQKIKVVENKEFTKAYDQQPQAHRTRVTVVTSSGERLVAEAGGDQDDLAAPKSDAQIAEKFRGLTEDVLGAKQVNTILDRLWHLEDLENVAGIPPAFVLC